MGHSPRPESYCLSHRNLFLATCCRERQQARYIGDRFGDKVQQAGRSVGTQGRTASLPVNSGNMVCNDRDSTGNSHCVTCHLVQPGFLCMHCAQCQTPGLGARHHRGAPLLSPKQTGIAKSLAAPTHNLTQAEQQTNSKRPRCNTQNPRCPECCQAASSAAAAGTAVASAAGAGCVAAADPAAADAVTEAGGGAEVARVP